MTTQSLRAALADDLDRLITRAQAHDHPGDAEQYRAMRQLLKGPLAPDPYARTTIRGGHTLDMLTHYALLVVERRLKYHPLSLDVLQGSYTSANESSGGTHDGGGAVDLSPLEWRPKVHALRAVGFAAWHRPELWRNGVRIWGEHIHAVLIGNDKLSPEARDQVEDYRHHRNGLADHAPDDSWHPDPIPVFSMPTYRMEV